MRRCISAECCSRSSPKGKTRMSELRQISGGDCWQRNQAQGKKAPWSVEGCIQARGKELRFDLRHVSRVMLGPLYPLPSPAPPNRFPNPPMRKRPNSGSGPKAANQRAHFAVSSTQRFIVENWPCWVLARLAHTRLASWLGAKQMGRFTKRIITLVRKLGEARSFFFAPQPVNPSLLNRTMHLAHHVASLKGQNPFLARWAK